VAARAALATVVTILVRLLVAILVIALLNLLFRSPAAINWKFAIVFSLVIAAIWFLIVFASTWTDERAKGVRDHTVDPTFPGGSFYRGLYGALSIGMLIMMVGLYRQHESLWLQLIPVGLLALVWFGWPRRIYFRSGALEQRTYFGKMRQIPYRAVEYISYDKRKGYTFVAGEGNRIIHTPLHVDGHRFHELIHERTGKPVRGA
jgi:hypothetical protein